MVIQFHNIPVEKKILTQLWFFFKFKMIPHSFKNIKLYTLYKNCSNKALILYYTYYGDTVTNITRTTICGN